MARKIYDIFPPKTKRESNSIKEKQQFSNRPLILLITLLFLAASVSIYFVILRVTIELWPKTTLVEYSGTVTVSSNQYHHDIQSNTLPGKEFTLKLEESKSFLASGKETVEQKAEGILRIYNNYSDSPQTLIEETRFMSSDGRVYKSTERVSIPGKGFIDVKVKAAEGGEKYNIEKTTKFSIPGLKGTAMFTSIYAENLNPISGGLIDELPVITARDIEKAKEELLKSVSINAKEGLKTANPDYLFEDEMIKIELITESVGPEEGEHFESFDYSIRVEAKGFGLKESELKEFIKEALLSSIETDESMEIWDDSLKISYEFDNRTISQGEIVLNIHSSALAYSVIREDVIKNRVSGTSIESANRLLNDDQKIEKVKIEPRPSWLKKIPTANKVRVKISFN